MGTAEFSKFAGILCIALSQHHLLGFEIYVAYITQNARLDEAQAGIMIPGRNINKLRYADDTTLVRKKRITKESLDESERGE